MEIFNSLDEALVKLSEKMKRSSVRRDVRDFVCMGLPEPVMIKIENPSNRYVTIPSRKWNKLLPFAEIIWLLAGINDLDVLPGKYVKNLYTYSDNGRTWRAGYGPRIRSMSGILTDYDVSKIAHRNVYSGLSAVTDQLDYVIKCLRKDINTRQAVIEIADPVKDNFGANGELKVTKDQPCTRLLNFQMREGKLDLTVYIRSNDLVYGFSAVNVFNFCTLLELVASMIGVPYGNYYHVANDLHVYSDKLGMIDAIVREKGLANCSLERFTYQNRSINNVGDLDKELQYLFNYINQLQAGDYEIPEATMWKYDLFLDTAKVFFQYHTGRKVQFINPYLNNLFYGN